MSTVKPGVVGYLKTDDFVPVGSPYGVNQQPAAGSVVSDMSTFFSATPATDNTPGGTATFLFQTTAVGATQTKVVDRNYIIQKLGFVKLTANGGAGDQVVVSKVSVDGLTATPFFTLDLNKNKWVFGDTGSTAFGGAPLLAAGETLKIVSTNATDCSAFIFVDVVGA